MAERSRSRSRSPEGGAPPADDPSQNENGDAPPPSDAPADDGEEVKLYIGNLDYATDETSLRNAFGDFGTITDVFLPIDRTTQRPRGFGFVTYSNRAAAESAIAKMDQQQLDGRTIRVNESRPKGEGPPRGAGGGSGFNAAGSAEVKLYVGNLSFETPEEAVRRLFEACGQVTDCFLPTDRDSGRPRGFGFVTMAAADAEKACNQVNGQELDGRTLRVNEAQPKGFGGGGSGGGGGRGGFGGGGYDSGGYGGGGGGGGGYGGGGGGYSSGGGGYGGGDGGGYDRGGRGGYDDKGYGGYGGGGYDDRGGGGYGGGGGYDRGGSGYNDRGGGGYSGRGGGYSGGGGGGYDRY